MISLVITNLLSSHLLNTPKKSSEFNARCLLHFSTLLTFTPCWIINNYLLKQIDNAGNILENSATLLHLQSENNTHFLWTFSSHDRWSNLLFFALAGANSSWPIWYLLLLMLMCCKISGTDKLIIIYLRHL